MLRHVVLFRWAEGTTPETVGTVQRALSELPSALPEIRSYRVGPDAGLIDGNWDFAVVADFDDAAGWEAYNAHPAHQRLVAELIRPMMAERAALQYEH